jgi:selenocysteine-specific elongation factor
MKRIIIGTAGHVDHGKTSLIKALTGVDCDRLKEEKERGLTIELGFTSLELPSGERVGVVDVPGHIKFIRHMLSGASGIDLVLLLVAADEGVMPQTKEHIQICELLGIKRGLVVLTKVDLVDEDLLELAISDIKDFVSTTFLKDAPIVTVSSTTKQGLDELIQVLDEQISLIAERKITGIPVLPVDRVFSIKGFGTVVTGTLSRGFFAEDQEVEILPGGHKAKVRNIQVHGQEVDKALAGMRTAINLQGLGIEDISRGEWIVPVGVFRPTRVIDAHLNLIDKPGKGNIKLHIDSTETIGEMSLHKVDGQDVARIRLKEPIVTSFGSRFIIRKVSPSFTIGGGSVLNPYPTRRFSEDIIQDLLSQDFARCIVGLTKDAGVRGITKQELASAFADKGQVLDKTIQDLLSNGQIIRFDNQNDVYVYCLYAQNLQDLMIKGVKHYHAMNPASSGISREHLRSSLKGNVNSKLFHKVLQDLIRRGDLKESGPDISAAGFSASLGDTLGELSEKVYDYLNTTAFEPPKKTELAQQFGVRDKEIEEILGFLSRQGRLSRIKDDLYITDVYEAKLKEDVREFIITNQSLNPTDMKTMFGVSRKYAIPYLEYLDRIHFTVRVDNIRKLASSHKSQE